jgi:alpha-mannosidase
MRYSRALTPLAAFAVLSFGDSSLGQTGTKPQLYYIPHTHWEGAVFMTREEYLQDGLDLILEAVRLLERYPEYKFTLDQVAYFRPFLERYPEQAAKFRKFIAEGRLEIVGGMDVMPDDVKPGAETFVRQVQYGKGYCQKELGLDIDVAWMLDTFGHHPQMPQLLDLAGFKSFWFCRGIPSDTAPSEFFWRGIDGSTIPAFCLPGFYGLFYGPPRDIKGFTKSFEDNYNFLNPNARGHERVGLAGNDVSEPEDFVTPLVREFNSKADAPFEIRYSVPTEFANIVAKRKDTPTFGYDLNPIFPGTYSSRIELKQAAKRIENKLLDAEELGALANLTGAKTDDRDLWQAWEPDLFNQTHDLASGTMNDHTYVDTVKSYDFSERLADEGLASRWKKLAANIDTAGEGAPIVVFNSSGWARTDLVEVNVGFADTGVTLFNLVGPSGEAISYQITYLDKYTDGGLKRAKIAFVAKDVPACGYATYRLINVRSKTAGLLLPSIPTSPGSLENEFYRVNIDPKTGAIVSVVDKELGTEMLSGPANVVARKQDSGDLWAFYKTLDGASHIPNMTVEPIPSSKDALLSSSSSEKEGTFVRGDAYSEFSVTHPLGTGRFTTRIRLTKGVKRIDIETTLVNNEKHVRYQVLFPSAVANGKNVQSIPFGSVERPSGVEFPAQSWTDYGNGQSGLGLVNAALPGNMVTDGTIMLSLMRAENLGDYNGGDTSETGMELNVPRAFRYALIPHAKTWKEALLPRAAEEINHPLQAFKLEPHRGSLPSKWGFLSVSSPNIVVTSVKPGPDGTTMVRLYESWGQATKGAYVDVAAQVRSADEANLLEKSTGKLRHENDRVLFDLHPFEIKTIKLHLGAVGLRTAAGSIVR